MAIDFEEALSGKHGEVMRKVAEDAVASAVQQLGEMLNPSGLRAMPDGMERFASGGVFNPPSPECSALATESSREGRSPFAGSDPNREGPRSWLKLSIRL